MALNNGLNESSGFFRERRIAVNNGLIETRFHEMYVSTGREKSQSRKRETVSGATPLNSVSLGQPWIDIQHVKNVVILRTETRDVTEL